MDLMTCKKRSSPTDYFVMIDIANNHSQKFYLLNDKTAAAAKIEITKKLVYSGDELVFELNSIHQF